MYYSMHDIHKRRIRISATCRRLPVIQFDFSLPSNSIWIEADCFRTLIRYVPWWQARGSHEAQSDSDTETQRPQASVDEQPSSANGASRDCSACESAELSCAESGVGGGPAIELHSLKNPHCLPATLAGLSDDPEEAEEDLFDMLRYEASF